MPLETQSRVSPFFLRMLAGLETGVVAGAAMLVLVAITSRAMSHQSVWSVPNLIGSLFYDTAGLRQTFSKSTLAGLALHVFVSGTLGVILSIVLRDSRSRFRAALAGILLAMVWYHLSSALFWKRVGGLTLLYSSPPALLAGHVVFGLLMGRYPGSLRSIKNHFDTGRSDPSAASPQS